MKIRFNLLLANYVVCFGLLPGTCPAETQVSGFVAGQTWTSAGSPYQVVGDVFVTGLTIESNVVVKVAPDFEFEVAGLLRVRGTSNAPVLFTANNSDAGWRGILFRDAVPGSYFTHTVFEKSFHSALRITNTPPALTNCIIRDNTSPWWGGGIMARLSELPLILQGCTISNNHAGKGVTGDSIWGGGLCVLGPVVLSQTSVIGNRADGYDVYGAGIFVRGDCTARKTQITQNMPNAARYNNGHALWLDTGSLEMANCVISSNGVPGSASYYGGAVTVATGARGTVENSLVLNNSYQGVYAAHSSLFLLNCTVNANRYQGLVSSGSTVATTNCIIYFNYESGEQINGSVSVAYSDVQGGVRPGPGNISFSPALCPGTYALIAGSPCIDAGDPNPIYNDRCIDNNEICSAFSRGEVRNDMGVYGGPGACEWLAGDKPVIVTQPRNESSCLGQTVSFAVGASGAKPLTYQWYRQGIELPGANSPELTITNLQSGDAGAYHVTVSNLYGSASCNPVQLVVNDACIEIKMYAGLTITGLPGRTYVLRCSRDLSIPSDQWPPCATNTMSAEGWFYLDMESPGYPSRYYSVQLQP